MRIIINTVSLSATGATQVSASFINECKTITENEYHVLLSKTVAGQIETEKFPPNFKFYQFSGKPLFTYNGYKVRKQLAALEKEIQPDCVFSVFGPSIWTPQVPHLMGYAYPYYVYPESPYFKIINWKLKFRIKLYSIMHRYYLRKNGAYYVCETRDVSERLPKYLGCKKDKIFTVTNTASNYFDSYIPSSKSILPPKQKNEFRFVTLASFALHKNIGILNKVIPILKKKLPDTNVKFVLTLNEALFNMRMTTEAKESIYNLGRINVADCPQVYYECDAMFLPSLMECFSASYAEAMKMNKPVVTSDLSFAKIVCGDAALYFDPLNAEDIAEKMAIIIRNSEIGNNLILNGHKQLTTFDTASERAKKYLDICKGII